MIVAVVVGFGVIFAFLVVLISCGVSNGFFFCCGQGCHFVRHVHSVQWPSCFYEFCDMCILFFMNFVAWRDVVVVWFVLLPLLSSVFCGFCKVFVI